MENGVYITKPSRYGTIIDVIDNQAYWYDPRARQSHKRMSIKDAADVLGSHRWWRMEDESPHTAGYVEEERIKPCGYCGYTQELPRLQSVDDNKHQVHCAACGYSGPYGESRESAVDIWNNLQ